jgi:hypothetical protein
MRSGKETSYLSYPSLEKCAMVCDRSSSIGEVWTSSTIGPKDPKTDGEQCSAGLPWGDRRDDP